MSLLIKALEKAEKGKAADSSNELALEPKAKPSQAASGKAPKEVSQQVAATVFTAKTEQKKSPSSSKALWAGIAVILILAVAGLQFYAYLNGLNKPEIVMPRASAVRATTMPVASQPEAPVAVVAQIDQPAARQAPASDPASTAAMPIAAGNEVKSGPVANPQFSSNQLAKAPATTQVFAVPSGPGNLAVSNMSNARQKTTAVKSQQLRFGEPVQMSHDTSVQVTRNQPANGVNPNLWAAYQAFNAGDDAAAQRNYRQVLQSDVRNVDALLGMAAIAARQGRNNDAAGWYSKVLEVEPRNDVAQAAMVNVLAQADPVSSESRIKNLIAQQPEAAHLYASLGNLYAEQNQWPSAQQAYFQAFHFDQNNAEYAFNLAVSLEQLGKSGLALPYYQRALALLPANGASSIDRAQLESRIAKLQ